MNPKVCMIVCNWNKKEDVIRCVRSLLRSSWRDYCVVVVDNHSSDGSAGALRDLFPDVEVIENPDNLGGAGGFNVGLSYALQNDSFTHAWLLDNDVVVDENALASLLKTMGADERIAVAGSLILKMETPEIVQELGAFVDMKHFALALNKRDVPLDEVDVAGPVTVDYVPACSLLVRLDRVREIGLLQEDFFLYFDDVDWCYRFRKKDYRVVADPASKVWHRSGARTRKNNMHAYYDRRNHFYFFRSILQDPEEIRSFVPRYIQKIFTPLYITALSGKINSHHTILWAITDVLRGIKGKARENRILPVDENPWARFNDSGLKTILVLGENLEHYSGVEGFFRRLQKPDLEIILFQPDCAADLYPASLRDRFSSLTRTGTDIPFHAFDRILVLCRHILEEPNRWEGEWDQQLRTHADKLVYMDCWSNLLAGYFEMRQERSRYRVELQEALSRYAPILTDFLIYQDAAVGW